MSSCSNAPLVLVLCALLAFASASTSGCSSDGGMTDATPDLALTDDAPDLLAAPAFDLRPPMPMQPPVENPGGAVLAAARVYTVVWAGDEALGKQVDQFHKDMLASDYWTTSMKEYGVGAGTGAGVIVLPLPVPQSLGSRQYEAIIVDLIAKRMLPAPNANTLVDFMVPASIAVVDGTTLAKDCAERLGYHTEISQAPFVPYIVVLPCPPGDGQSDFDRVTETDSHELAESASDPHPYSDPGWQNPWLANYGEIGDLCNDINYSLTVAGGATYAVTHIYSGAAAAMGGVDPCLPGRPGPYWNVGVTPANITIVTDGSGKGSTQVKLMPFSYGTAFAMRWTIFASGVTVRPSSGTNKPGDQVTVTITASSGAQMQPTWFTVLTADPKNPAAWGQEWITSLTIN